MDSLTVDTSGVVAALGEVFQVPDERMLSSVVDASVDVKISRCRGLMRLKEELDALNVNTSGVVAALEAIFEVTTDKNVFKISLTGLRY